MGPCRLAVYNIFYFRLLGVLAVIIPLVVAESCEGVEVNNGAVYKTSDHKLSNSLFVHCHDGFHLEPSDGAFSCQDGLVLSEEVPRCVPTMSSCNHTCTLLNGNCSSLKSSFTPGERVSYECNEGFVLKGDAARECGLNGKWNGSDPECLSSGRSCIISKSDAVRFSLDPDFATTFEHDSTREVRCQKGYYDPNSARNQKTNLCCRNGEFDKDLTELCRYVGVKVHISYTLLDDESKHLNETLNLEKGVNVSLTCKVRADTQDGLPFPDVTWVYPSRLRDLVDFKEGDAFKHEDYINSINPEYSLVVEEDVHYIVGVLSIAPTMEIHSGEYTCRVKLVDYTNSSSTAVVSVDKDLHIGLYFLLIIPVVLFVIVHCFYRKATLSPFPGTNKLTKDMMQEVDKKKKLEELQANPAYQQIQVMGGEKNQRGRRGAVVDI